MRPATNLSAPIAAFVSVELVAVFFWLFVGRRQWFHHDEWDEPSTATATAFWRIAAP